MSLAPFYSNPRARFYDENVNPLAGGRISFFYPSTTTLKEVYTDSTGQTPATNPHILNANGQVRDGGVWLGEGNYKVVLEKSDGAGGFIEQWTMDDIPSGVLGAEFLSQLFVDTIENLRTIIDGAGGIVYVKGYYAIGDGGGGFFYWDEDSSADDDGGAVISPTGDPSQGRWIRIFGDDISVWQFGAMGTAPDFVDSQLVRATFFAENDKRKKVVIPSDTYNIQTTFPLGGSIHIEVQEGATFIGGGDVTLDPSSLNIIGQKPLVDASTDITINPNEAIDCYADWWGDAFVNKSEGRYPAKLKFNGLYNVNATAPSTHGFWLIEDDTEITINNTATQTTIKGYIADKNQNDVFGGSYNLLRITEQNEFSVNHFTDSLISVSSYQNLLDLVTDTRSRSAILNFGGQKNYVSVPSFARPSSDYFIQSRVLGGSLIQFNQNCWIGTIINEPRDRIFAEIFTAYPIIDNSEVYAQWYGAGRDASNNNYNALVRANGQLGGGNIIPVNGDGETFNFNTLFMFETANKREAFNFKNMKFSISLTSSGTGTILVGFLNDVILEDFDVSVSDISGNDFARFIIGNQGQEIIVAKCTNCNFNSTFNGSFHYGNNTYDKCSFRASNQVFIGDGVYTNCEFSSNVTSNPISVNHVKDPNFNFPFVMNSSIVSGQFWVTETQSGFFLSDNKFIANDQTMIQFFGDEYKDVRIQNNSFTNTGSNLTIPSMSAGVGSGNSYINCYVSSNSFVQCAEKTTQISLFENIDDTYDADTYLLGFLTDNVIFAYRHDIFSNTALPLSASGSINRNTGFGTNTSRYAYSMATAGSLEFRKIYTGANPIGQGGGAYASATIKFNDSTTGVS